jgi:ABC-type branched-subunit amino acid transport system substrate-binding protein
VLTALVDELDPPRVVFYAGDHARGADLRMAMSEAGRLSTPLLSWDALIYGAAGGSYLERIGPANASGTYAAHASLPDQKFSWADAYRRRFGAEPDEYAGAGYACTELVVAALKAASEAGTSSSAVRDFVRAYLVDPARSYETVLGTVAFDANGDALRQFVTFYRIDASAAGGAGEWVIAKKQDFGPAL